MTMKVKDESEFEELPLEEKTDEFMKWCKVIHVNYVAYLKKANFEITQKLESGRTKVWREINFRSDCDIKWGKAIVIKCWIEKGEELYDALNAGTELFLGVVNKFSKTPKTPTFDSRQMFVFNNNLLIQSCWLDHTVYDSTLEHRQLPSAHSENGENQDQSDTLQKKQQKEGLAVCTMIGRPLSYKYVREFVEYHRVVGVDHIFFYFFGDETHLPCFEKQLEYARQDGFVTVFNLREIIRGAPPIMQSPYSQFYNYIVRHDCYHRFKDVFKYTMNLDDDEFFTPVEFDSVHDVIRSQNMNDTALGVKFDGHFVAPFYAPPEDLFVDSFVAVQKQITREEFVGTPKFILQRNDKRNFVVKSHHAHYSEEYNPSRKVLQRLEYSDEAIIVHFQSWKAVAANEYNPIDREDGQVFPYPPMSRFFPELRRRIAEAPVVEYVSEECRKIYHTDLEEFLAFIQKRERPIDNLKFMRMERNEKKRDLTFLGNLTEDFNSKTTKGTMTDEMEMEQGL